jgi:hypothetical protein
MICIVTRWGDDDYVSFKLLVGTSKACRTRLNLGIGSGVLGT